MSTRAFCLSLANMVLVYLLGVGAAQGWFHGWAVVVGLVVGSVSYQLGKRMIKAGLA